MLRNSRGNPIFIKEDTTTRARIEALRNRLLACTGREREGIELDIRLASIGLQGEDSIAFELSNSHMDMCVLRDLHLALDGLSAQIDFLVLLPHVSVVIECKNLVGNIEVNERGDFVREFGQGRYAKREGIYSPITQNVRHLDLIRDIRNRDAGAVKRLAQNLFFDDMFKSVVVLANPKTVLSADAAPEEVSRSIVRGDQLIAFLKNAEAEGKKAGNGKRSARELREAGEYWLAKHVGAAQAGGLSQVVDASGQSTEGLAGDAIDSSERPACPKCGKPMVERVVKRGERKGKRIWGCPDFPKCRGVVNIEDQPNSSA